MLQRNKNTSFDHFSKNTYLHRGIVFSPLCQPSVFVFSKKIPEIGASYSSGASCETFFSQCIIRVDVNNVNSLFDHFSKNPRSESNVPVRIGSEFFQEAWKIFRRLTRSAPKLQPEAPSEVLGDFTESRSLCRRFIERVISWSIIIPVTNRARLNFVTMKRTIPRNSSA